MSGRFIDQNIRKSKKIAKLSPKSLALFALLIPHYNAHGKLNGEPHFIKGQACPLVDWLPIKEIKKCLTEISEKTNVKWFSHEGLYYLQSLNWKEHQPGLRRLGPDLLPDYSWSGPGLLPPDVDVDVDKDKDIDKDKDVDPGVLPKLSFGEFQKVRLKPLEKEKLDLKLGNESVNDLINALDRSIESEPKKYGKYKNHYAVILKWAEIKKNNTKELDQPGRV